MNERSERTDEHSVSHAQESDEHRQGGGVDVLVPHVPSSDAEGLVAAGEVPETPEAGVDTDDPTEPFGPPMPADRLRGWVVTLVVTLIAALVRFWNLGFPTDKGTPVFDEKHYAPQAWQVLRNGGYEDNPGYELVVHPPFGKQLMAVGEALFGYNAWGWRFSAAVAGTVCVLLIVRITRRMTRSTLLGAIAGVLLICDGVSHVQSRIGMLDIFLVVFVLGAFACLLVDRDQVRERLAAAVRAGTITQSAWGPRLGFRWWRVGCAVCIGLACGVKWSGLYFLVAFGLLNMLWNVTARRTAGVPRPLASTLLRDLLPTVLAFGFLTVGVYLATWWAWFGSETGIDRHAFGKDIGGSSSPFLLMWDALRSLLYYSGNVLHFHETLLTPRNNPHPWESKPWSWPMGMRPMLYYYESGSAAAGCGQSDCVGALMLIGTPAMWWLAFPMLAWSIWRAFSRLDWRYAAVLVGYGAGWLPWFINTDRQMYFFYATVMAPFLVLGLTMILGEVLGKARAGVERRGTGLLLVALYVGLVVANFVWLWPVLNGNSITPWQWQAELWLPSWR